MGNSAANNAGVTVAIVGLANKNNASYQKYIFDETLVRQTVTHINPYLASGEIYWLRVVIVRLIDCLKWCSVVCLEMAVI